MALLPPPLVSVHADRERKEVLSHLGGRTPHKEPESSPDACQHTQHSARSLQPQEPAKIEDLQGSTAPGGKVLEKHSTEELRRPRPNEKDNDTHHH